MKTSKKSLRSTRAVLSLREFEKTDLGHVLQASKGSGRWIIPTKRTRPTSIALTDETIQTLKHKASRKGIGYQTLLKMIVQEHLHEY